MEADLWWKAKQLIGEAADRWQHGYVIGADFQMGPDLVSGVGLPRRLGAAVVAPTGSQGTIRGPGEREATIYVSS